MKILFCVPSSADYLAITLLHGLRQIPGVDVVDYPRYSVAYDDYPAELRRSVYGRGFSVFFLLEEVAVDRTRIEERLSAGEFDLVIFASIWRTFETFALWRSLLDPNKTLILDGEDTPQVYPAAGLWWRRPRYWKLPAAHKEFLYFKREWTPDSRFDVWHRLCPRSVRARLPYCANLRKISFSFPEEKISERVALKTKTFPRHIVDQEVAARVGESSISYVFDNEEDYYADLRSSRFGVTTKRRGWDCLRHYELAASGCVLCFRDLHLKPETCAPHGLLPGMNCIVYSSAEELMRLIEALDPEEERRLAAAAIEWAWQSSTRARALGLLSSAKSRASG